MNVRWKKPSVNNFHMPRSGHHNFFSKTRSLIFNNHYIIIYLSLCFLPRYSFINHYAAHQRFIILINDFGCWSILTLFQNNFNQSVMQLQSNKTTRDCCYAQQPNDGFSKSNLGNQCLLLWVHFPKTRIPFMLAYIWSGR